MLLVKVAGLGRKRTRVPRRLEGPTSFSGYSGSPSAYSCRYSWPSMNGQPEMVAQRVHHRHTHAMQTTGHLVGVRVELAAGVQHRHHHLGGGTALLRMDVDRDSAAVVAD